MMEVDFFQEEEREGYLVSAEMKQLWAVELDIMEVFKAICEKHNISYFAAGGTLLGAARHKGYIPWDDDVDIQLKQEDYEKFVRVVKEELTEPYFFQEYTTEENFSPYFARIRRIDTTAYTVGEKESNPDGANGIWIDLFCMAIVPDNRIIYFAKILRLKFLRALLSGNAKLRKAKRMAGIKEWKEVLHPCTLLWAIASLFTTRQKLCQHYVDVTRSTKKGKRIAATQFRPGDLKLTWDAEDFNEIIELPFENTMIAVPKNYEKILTQQYGDWHTPVKGTQYHSGVVFEDKKE